MLEAHPWPGNVRELRNVIERAVILARGAPIITTEHVRLRSHGIYPSHRPPGRKPCHPKPWNRASASSRRWSVPRAIRRALRLCSVFRAGRSSAGWEELSAIRRPRKGDPHQ